MTPLSGEWLGLPCRFKVWQAAPATEVQERRKIR
jgi:hypothetical protein